MLHELFDGDTHDHHDLHIDIVNPHLVSFILVCIISSKSYGVMSVSLHELDPSCQMMVSRVMKAAIPPLSHMKVMQ